jgi:spore maturation protein CgeB
VAVFVWEKAYLPWLRQIGFEKSHYLPLATDPAIFASATSDSEPSCMAPETLVFVADSLAATARKALQKLPLDVLETVVAMGHAQADDGLGLLGGKDSPELRFGDDLKADIESAASLIATRRRRLEFMRSILDSHRLGRISIFGDAAWKESLCPDGEGVGGSLEIHPTVDYYRELPGVYRAAGAVLNLTSRQMPTALNQRCYDVPAAGGFLLTDRQPELYHQFEPEKEIVAFDSCAEMLDKWDFYRMHPKRRQEIIAAGRRRVLQEHTYRRRIQQALLLAQSWFGWKSNTQIYMSSKPSDRPFEGTHAHQP